MFEFSAFLPPTNLGLPMPSPSALTEHVPLNLARFFVLDPVHSQRQLRPPTVASLLRCLSVASLSQRGFLSSSSAAAAPHCSLHFRSQNLRRGAKRTSFAFAMSAAFVPLLGGRTRSSSASPSPDKLCITKYFERNAKYVGRRARSFIRSFVRFF